MTEPTWPSRTSIFFSTGVLLALLLLGFLALGVLGDAYEPLGDFPRQTLDWVRHNGPGGAVKGGNTPSASQAARGALSRSKRGGRDRSSGPAA